MARYKDTEKGQGLFLTVNLSEQLAPGTFEWTLDYLIDRADLSLFDQKYNNDEKGAPAYEPRVLLKLIMYCYSTGIISSRKIEDASKVNIIAKALAEDCKPDHDTIATFISTNSEAVKELFTQILIQCGELGLITGEMFAIDGCKLPSNASKEWSGKLSDLQKKKADLEKLASKIIKQYRELGKSEGAKKKQRPFRETMGDDKKRRKRHIERIEKKLKKLDGFLEEAKPRQGVSGAEIKSNITDNESAFIMGPHGYIQGYNGIAVADGKNQVIVAAEAYGSGPESCALPEMLDSLEENMKTITGKEEPLKRSLCLGDTGYFSENNLQEAAKRGIPVLIPDTQFRKRDTYFDCRKCHTKKHFASSDFAYNKAGDYFVCPMGERLTHQCKMKVRNTPMIKYQARRGACANCRKVEKCIASRDGKNPRRTVYIKENQPDENLSEKMRKKIDDAAYRELYARRMQIIEPMFSNMTYNKKMDRFTMRTQIKVNIQWLLYCIMHNIGKCIRPLELEYGY